MNVLPYDKAPENSHQNSRIRYAAYRYRISIIQAFLVRQKFGGIRKFESSVNNFHPDINTKQTSISKFISRSRAPHALIMFPLVNFKLFFNESHPCGSRERKRTFWYPTVNIYMKWWPIARGEMAIESRRGLLYHAEIQRLYASSKWGRSRAFSHPHEQKINIKSTHALSKMAKKINSAKINKNIENVGEYSEMIKDTKMEHSMFQK